MKTPLLNNKAISPKSYLKTYVFEKTPKLVNKKKKLQEFTIPSFTEFDFLLCYNYKVSQLREICSYYKLKKTGNKDELTNLIYNHLKYSNYSLIIQRNLRGYFQRLYNKLRGPGFVDPKTRKNICVNENDFYTMESLEEIPYFQFISVKSDKQIYGFDMKSLFTLFLTGNKEVLNPYNRSVIPRSVVRNIKKLVRLSSFIGEKSTIKIEQDQDISEQKMEEMHIIELFQTINELGNYSDHKWYYNLPRRELIIFVRELFDIWSYRAQLTPETKINIFPPSGRPFDHIDLARLHTYSDQRIKYWTTRLIENLVKCGVNHDSKCLGAYYVLASLTLVNEEARQSLPWLYQSVAHTT